jgi:HTH-type transcriptional regulator/antitoxin HigA
MAVKSAKTTPTDTYLACVMDCPLQAIKTDRQHDQAIAAMSRLAVRGRLDAGELQYVEALSQLIADFESRAPGRVKRSSGNPLDVLKFLMSQSRMSVSALGAILGSQGVASEILAGKRELIKRHMRSLAAHFRVEPGLFL